MVDVDELVQFQNIVPSVNTLESVTDDQEVIYASRLSRFTHDMMNDFLMAWQERTGTTKLQTDALFTAFSELEVVSTYAAMKLFRPILISAFSNPELKKVLLDCIDETVTCESDRLKQQAHETGILEYDAVVYGSGPHGAAAAAKILETMPGARILILERKKTIGGQFRAGDRNVYRLNSRSHRQVGENNDGGLPGGNVNINPLGSSSVLQLPDATTETYPGNAVVGDLTAINGFMSGDIMVDVDYQRDLGADKFGSQHLIEVKDNTTGEIYHVKTDLAVGAPGIGGQQKDDIGSNSVPAFEFFEEIGDSNNHRPMQQFNGKTVVVMGGGDTAKSMVAWLCRLQPIDSYGLSTPTIDPGPKKIVWVKSPGLTNVEFARVNRSKYVEISAFLPREVENYENLVSPNSQRVGRITLVDGKHRVQYASGENLSEPIDTVLDGRTLDPTDVEKSLAGQTVLVRGKLPTVPNEQSVILGRISSDSAVLLAGPAGRVPLTETEKRRGANIGENTVALWATMPRTDAMVVEALERRARILAANGRTGTVFASLPQQENDVLRSEIDQIFTPDKVKSLIKETLSNTPGFPFADLIDSFSITSNDEIAKLLINRENNNNKIPKEIIKNLDKFEFKNDKITLSF